MSSSAGIAPRTSATPPRADSSASPDSPPRPRRAEVLALALAALVGAAAWLPFLHAPLTSDESGFLLLGRHLGHGTSLYGDYWVDRPPLLLWLFSLAGHLGAVRDTSVGIVAPGVKLLGAAATGLSILLAGVIAHLATGLTAPTVRWPRRAATALAVLLLATPLFGMPETDGELLALPLVLAALACLLALVRRPHARALRPLAALAGASGAGAALIKQNVLDVFVFALVLAAVSRRHDLRLRQWVPAFAGGALVVVAGALALAAAQGTSPAALWDAVVVFRLHASAVIGSSASGTTSQRFVHLLDAFALSGGAAALLLGVVLTLRKASALRWPVLALVAWEVVGVAGGGSYWLHYLTGLVPGLVLLLSLVAPGRRGRRLVAAVVAAVLAYTAVATVTGWVQHVGSPTQPSTDAQVMSYLRSHARRGDGVVVAFGHPDIVAGSGLASPYPQLWSLPVRVNDPSLVGFDRTLSGPAAPRWVVVSGQSVASWGLDATEADRILHAHYVEEASFGEWYIWQRAGGTPR